MIILSSVARSKRHRIIINTNNQTRIQIGYNYNYCCLLSINKYRNVADSTNKESEVPKQKLSSIIIHIFIRMVVQFFKIYNMEKVRNPVSYFVMTEEIHLQSKDLIRDPFIHLGCAWKVSPQRFWSILHIFFLISSISNYMAQRSLLSPKSQATKFIWLF